MIRVSALISLITLLILVLYVPASNPPDRFTNQIRLEHEAAIACWGENASLQILERAVVMQSKAAAAAPIPQASDAPPADSLNYAVATEMVWMNQRLFSNAYFRSVDALLLLGSYRLSSLLQWLPWLFTFALSTVVDGIFTRSCKAKELEKNNPEAYAAYASLAIAATSMTTAGFFVPTTLHPLLMPAVPPLIFALFGKMADSYHP